MNPTILRARALASRDFSIARVATASGDARRSAWKTRRPLVNRCACGRQISDTRASCLKCANEHVLQLAGEIHSPEAMVRVLELVPKDQREEVFQKLKQHIDITALVSESVAASDAAPVDSDVAPSPVNSENR